MFSSRPLSLALGSALLIAVWTPSASADEADECAAIAEKAQGLRKDGKLVEARDVLGGCAIATCPDFVRSDCTRWLAEVDSVLPTVVVRASDPEGRDLVDVRVLVDDRPLVDTLDGKPAALDPGVHTFRFEADGREPVAQRVVVAQGETNRVLRVTLRALPPAGPVSLAPNATAPKPVPSYVWGIGALGVVSLGFAGVLWGQGWSQRADLQDSCAPAHACSQADVDSARTKLLVGDVVAGVGLAAIGLAVALFLHARSAEPVVRSGRLTWSTP